MVEVLEKKVKAKVKAKNSSKLKPPKNYFVIMVNDNYTPMEFVIYLLRKYFNKNASAAEHIMLKIHTNGEGVAGLYPFQIAEQKAYNALFEAKESEFPLNIHLKESS